MDDDGVLINFDAGSAPFIPQPKFKGGRWIDRLHAKKSAQRRQAYAAGSIEPSLQLPRTESESKRAAQQDGLATAQPTKKLKTYKTSIKKPSEDAPGAFNRSRYVDNNPNRSVISSLFSFNPSTNTAEYAKQDTDVAPAAPSNAPLSPELQNFTNLGLSSHLASHLLNKMSIKAPTAVQRAAVSKLLSEDADAFIQAETGSGKTLAYLLPIVQKLWAISMDAVTGERREEVVSRDSGLFAVILAPTRELTKQISVVLETLLRCVHWIVSTTVTGGEKKKSEKARLRKGINILIATPGRLADHLEHTSVLDVRNVKWLVLDEGDRLMELGFEKDIEKILGQLEEKTEDSVQMEGLPQRRVTILCSATMKMDVQRLGELSLKDAVHIRGNTLEDERNEKADEESKSSIFAAPAQLQQSFATVPAKLRLVTLVALLKRTFARHGSVKKVIVFMSCSDSVDFHFDVFARPSPKQERNPRPNDPHNINTNAPAAVLSTQETKVRVFRLHGSLSQPIRTSTLTQYRTHKDPAVLISTDVASRGLDLPNVDLVLEYDPAFSRDDHLHRIGRTARAGNDGRSMIFLLPGPEEAYADAILTTERADGTSRVPTRHNCDDILKKGFTGTGITGDKDWQHHATEWQLDIERWTVENPTKLELARRAFQSHLRAYATHVASERGMFDMTQLHLGHIAKAFALRDRPGNIRVPGFRPSKDATNADNAARRAQASKSSRQSHVDDDRRTQATDIATAKRKMAATLRAQNSLSEFNLG